MTAETTLELHNSIWLANDGFPEKSAILVEKRLHEMPLFVL